MKRDIHVLPDRQSIRVVFFGTPDYAVPSLAMLANDDRFEVVLVVTQPDRPAGRRHQLTAPPVKIVAEQAGLQVIQPESLRTPADRAPLVDAAADVFVVAAYGRIFGEKTLAIPPSGCLNLHASLLPKYRGASPIAAAILAGDEQTGVSLMRMEPGLDTGPVYAAEETPIYSHDTTDSLTARLAHLGPHLIREHLESIVARRLQAVEQSSAGASMTRPVLKADGQIDWDSPAEHVERHVRAMWPWPRAWTLIEDQTIQIHSSQLASDHIAGDPGSFADTNGRVLVRCGRGVLELKVVQVAGGRPIPASSWLAGYRGQSRAFDQRRLSPASSPLIESLS